MDPPPTRFVFGAFVLDTGRRALLRDGAPVELSARAFDLLQALIEGRDRVLGRDELMARAWPGVVVEPSNLTVQMSGLRRALGDTGREPTVIATVTGRGYRFVAAVVPEGAVAPAAAAAAKRKAPQRRWWLLLLGVPAAILALAAALLLRPGRAPPPPRLSIAVLPFRNLSGDARRDYLADAISDDLTTDLSRIPGSLVIARESADVYKGRAVPAPEIGRALGVRYLLEGSLRAEGETLRINAQLIEAASGSHVWAERFDVAEAVPLGAQSEIVRRLASALDVALADAAAATVPRGAGTNAGAQDLFLRARSAWHRANTRAEFTAVQHLLEQAVAADPDDVDALALLGWLLVRKVSSFDYAAANEEFAEAERVIAHAMSLAPGNANVLAARGRWLTASDRCDEARAAFDTALAAEPNNVLALTGQALCAWKTGQPNLVIPSLQASLRVDPQGPAANRRYSTLGLAALFGGHPEAAVRYLLRAGAEDSDRPADTDTATPAEDTQFYLIAAYGLAGDPVEARRRARAFLAAWPRRSIWRHLTVLNPAQSAVPAMPTIVAALAAAGVPRFADEGEDLGVPTTDKPIEGGEFTPLPRTAPGARTIATMELRHLMARAAPPLVLDYGAHLAVPEGAVAVPDALADADRAALLRAPFGPRLAAGDVVVMGTGPSGPDGYNAVLHLRALGFGRRLWYRGGEESWAAAGLPAKDRR